MSHPDHPVVTRAKAAPVLDLLRLESPQSKGIVLDVARVATARLTDGTLLAWIETTDDQIFRLPSGPLQSWAYDVAAIALGLANPFPSKVEFGIVDGRPYAEIL